MKKGILAGLVVLMMISAVSLIPTTKESEFITPRPENAPSTQTV